MEGKTVEQMAEEFREILADVHANRMEGCRDDSFSRFFSEMIKESKDLNPWLLFCVETVHRMSSLNLKHPAVKDAQGIAASLPKTKQRLPHQNQRLVERNDVGYWKTQTRILSNCYVLVAKALISAIAQHGEVHITRQCLNEIDEAMLNQKYDPENDTILFSLVELVEPSTMEDRIKEDPEFAKAQREKFEAETGSSFEKPYGESVAIPDKETEIPANCPMGLEPHELSEEEQKEADRRCLEAKPGEHARCRCVSGKLGDKIDVDPSRLDLIE